MTAEEWADRVEICMRQLEPDERPPHSVTDFPRQYAATVKVICAAVAEERETCARWLDDEAANWIGDDSPCGAPMWQVLTHAAAAIRARS